MSNLDKYKRFWVIGTDSTNIHKAVAWVPPSRVTETPVNHSADMAPSSSPENSTRWKKSGFTAVTEVAPASIVSTVAPVSQMDMLDGSISPLTDNPVLHASPEQIRQEELSLETTIQEFLRQTGIENDKAGTEIAIRYLVQGQADVPAAVELYRTERRDESGDVVMGENSHHDTARLSRIGSDAVTMRKGSDSSGMFFSEYGRSRSSSISPMKTDMPKPPSTLSIEATTEWYKRKEEAGEAWSHIVVQRLKDTFVRLGIDKP